MADEKLIEGEIGNTWTLAYAHHQTLSTDVTEHDLRQSLHHQTFNPVPPLVDWKINWEKRELGNEERMAILKGLRDLRDKIQLLETKFGAERQLLEAEFRAQADKLDTLWSCLTPMRPAVLDAWADPNQRNELDVQRRNITAQGGAVKLDVETIKATLPADPHRASR
ncbi:hypothetical protein BDV29DRAFT_159024 [Aspergillus leporis]|uniref:Uncharacterized protein n=1 Tax=Aspergillus leporis TaxID=41062 RepID=A0A5N5WTM0_9EURO|nr:hypothetical protein BDV29DRAFT_159024 [Aspergillus leporis]